MLQAGRLRVQFLMVSLDFFIFLVVLAALDHEIDLAFYRNQCQEYFLGASCADCLEIWEYQPPGTLGACCTGLYRDCFTFYSVSKVWLFCTVFYKTRNCSLALCGRETRPVSNV